MESINDYQEREPRRQTAFGRWGQTVLGHFPFHAGIALLQSLSFLPGAACIYLSGGWEAPFFWRRAGCCWA